MCLTRPYLPALPVDVDGDQHEGGGDQDGGDHGDGHAPIHRARSCPASRPVIIIIIISSLVITVSCLCTGVELVLAPPRGVRLRPLVSSVATSEVITRDPAPLWAVSCTLYHVAGLRSEMMMFSSSDLKTVGIIS